MSDRESTTPQPNGRMPFPKNIDDFGQDHRISYDRTAAEHHLEDGGATFEWNVKHQKWIELMDQELVGHWMNSYTTAEVNEEDAIARNKKRKADEAAAVEEQKLVKKAKPESTNTSIYVSGIPLNVTLKEIKNLFSRYGVFSNNIDSGEPKVKLYTDEDGNSKGEAFISYYKRESLRMAIDQLDSSDFHTGSDGGSLRVVEADMNYKKQKEVPAGESNNRKRKDKKKIKQMTEKQNAKLEDWDEDADISEIKDDLSEDDLVSPLAPDHYVVLKNFFTFQQLKDDPSELQAIPTDIGEIAETHGEVTNIVVYDLEADGVVTVRFAEPYQAKNFAKAMHGTELDGEPPRYIKAYVPKGEEHYRQSGVETLFDSAANNDSEDDNEDDAGVVPEKETVAPSKDQASDVEGDNATIPTL